VTTINDIAVILVPLTRAQWEVTSDVNKAQLRTVFGETLSSGNTDMWTDAAAWEAQMNANPQNLKAPKNGMAPYQPWGWRYSQPEGRATLGILVDGAGKPVAQSLAPGPGVQTGNLPENATQPGTGTPSLLTVVLGQGWPTFWLEYGGYFVNGVPGLTWLPYDTETLHSPNFGDNGWFNQLPLAFSDVNNTGSPSTWPRQYFPLLMASGRVGIMRYDDVTKNLPKFGAQAPSTGAGPIAYRNDGAATAGVIAALQGAGLSGEVLGNAVNAAARVTK
jgi:hypothetical protein